MGEWHQLYYILSIYVKLPTRLPMAEEWISSPVLRTFVFYAPSLKIIWSNSFMIVWPVMLE